MKLSEMSTDKMLDVICEITPAVGEIIADEKVRKAFKDKVKIKEGDSAEVIREKGLKQGVKVICNIIPLILKNHRRDVYTILSVLNEKKIEEIEAQSPLITIKQVTELLSDKELIELFM